MRLREKELGAVKINASDIDIIVNELEFDKKVAERTMRVYKSDVVVAVKWSTEVHGHIMFSGEIYDSAYLGQKILEVEEMNPCPLHLEPFSISRDIQQAFPCVGTILRVFAKEFFAEIPQLQNGGQWIRLRNIFCLVDSGIWKGTFTSYSKIRLLSDQDDAVYTRQRSCLERISSVKERAPLNLPLSYLTGHLILEWLFNCLFCNLSVNPGENIRS